ncbi:hypothetical protein BD324DRAFT_607901 [Kockovaella imperatae]|uniref:Uncharacterized protein n=1 Tax=Kockovaella imperatae TaxID=4999 RepID=A0A1Y1UK23_9TREE|nr:hypothetical protein BD324DRAFT_607901 [Kockovaella imperatae]ORX38401.1 hypothetical protein BD324DRAFT_607901 [Kockovaella imperatae]
MSLQARAILPVVPQYHPQASADFETDQVGHTHIQSSLQSKHWLYEHQIPAHAYPSLPKVGPFRLDEIPHLSTEVDDQQNDSLKNERFVDEVSSPSAPLLPLHHDPAGSSSPSRLAAFVVDKSCPHAEELDYVPIPTGTSFLSSRGLQAPRSRPDGLKARKESSTLGVTVESAASPTDADEPVEQDLGDVIQTAKHGSPSKARMVRLSPLTPTTRVNADLLGSPTTPTGKSKLVTPLLPQIKVHLEEQTGHRESASPFEVYSPLIANLPRDAELHDRHDEQTSHRRTSATAESQHSRVGPGMTPSLAEVMDRVGVSAKRNRLDIDD